MRNPEVDYQHTTPATEFIEVWKNIYFNEQYKSEVLPMSEFEKVLNVSEAYTFIKTVCVFKIHPLNKESVDYKNNYKQMSETKVPIYAGCPNIGQCFCTGACKEIIGYRDKHPIER